MAPCPTTRDGSATSGADAADSRTALGEVTAEKSELP